DAADRSEGPRLRWRARPTPSRRTEIMADLRIDDRLPSSYDDVLTSDVIVALHALARFDETTPQVMQLRLERRAGRARTGARIAFRDPSAGIPGTSISVQAARDGRFAGSEIPHDLERQWIQGTGPAARPRSTVEQSIRNIAYALLSGADGWMFDGE